MGNRITNQEGDLKLISVFGSALPGPGSEPFEQARLVGQLLAQNGFAVATGGYGGTMTAVSQGAAEAGGHVIGVTSDQIEQFRPLGPNRWVMEEIRYKSLQERLLHLVTQNEGMIVLPGGIGTLSEMALAWSFLQVGEMGARPFAMLGALWPQTVQAFFDPLYIKQVHMDLLYFADSPQSAVAHMVQHHQS
jgi:uncharacterized protein (TIGR00730 family)